MFTVTFASRMLYRALWVLTALVALLVAILVTTLVSSSKAASRSAFIAQAVRIENAERAEEAHSQAWPIHAGQHSSSLEIGLHNNTRHRAIA